MEIIVRLSLYLYVIKQLQFSLIAKFTDTYSFSNLMH